MFPNRENFEPRQRQRSERMGRIAEWVATAYLMLKGYRIVAHRVRSPFGELDLIAVRGNRLAFVEVKYRRTLQSAQCSISSEQASRMATAAEQWAGKHPAYRNYRFGLDAIYLAPWRLPQHAIDGLHY